MKNFRVDIVAAVYVGWVFIAGGGLIFQGILDPSFISAWGPTKQDTTIKKNIFSVEKWILTAVYTFLNHSISSYAGNIVDPWITNEVQDDKIKKVRYSYTKTMIIVLTYQCASWLDYILFLAISLSRIDMMLIGIFADVISKGYAINLHLINKNQENTHLLEDMKIGL